MFFFFRIIKEIETIFGRIIIIQFSVGGFVMCLSVLQISIMSISEQPSRFVFMIIYLLAMTVAIFMPCYFGNEILLKNSMILYQMYAANWITLPLAFQKDIIIFMGSVMRDARILAGGFVGSNLKTFSSVSFFYKIFSMFVYHLT